MKKTAERKREKLILLDSHAILHRAYHALPDFVSTKGEPTGAIYGLVSMLISIIAELKPDYIVACYDLPGPTYRHEVYKDYKAGRAKTDSDLVAQLKRSRDVFHALNIPIYDKPGFEADDMLGTIVAKVLKGRDFSNIDIVIASGDMDTLQLVSGNRVQVYTLKKGIKDTILYDEDAVRARFGFGPEQLPDYKGLRGDPSDNIIGIKGIGEKTGATLIQTFGTVEGIYKALDAEQKTANKSKGKKAEPDYSAFTAVGITPRIIQLLIDGREEAQFSKMLATIRRDAPIDFQKPSKHFAEMLDMHKVNVLFGELNFRTFGARLTAAIGGAEKTATSGGDIGDSKNSDNSKLGSKEIQLSENLHTAKNKVTSGSENINSGRASLNSVEVVDPYELKKATIALWLLDSNLTNPGVEDVLNYALTHMPMSELNSAAGNGTSVAASAEKVSFATASDFIFKQLNQEPRLRKVYEEIELPVVPIAERMNARGVKIDRELLAKLSHDYHADLTRLEKEIWKHAGTEFNINSPKQLGEILFDRLMLTAKGLKKTSGGARSTRESELEKLRDAHPIVPLIFQYREFQKLLSTYIDTIPTLLDSNDRLHSNFIQTGTTTGRMASQDPNLQNIPVKTELGRAIRTAFIAEKGFVLGAFDYSQIELRVAAFLSGDEKLIEIFKNGEDVHTAVAAEVFNVSYDKVDREMRRRAKVINFGILYGMGVNALRTNLEEGDAKVTRAEAQEFYNAYFAKFSGLAHYLDKVKAETAQKGFTETFFGRRRSFEGINSRIPYVKAMAERMAINAPIQGTNADVVKMAMKCIDDYIEKNALRDDVFLILQVHDELVYEIRETVSEKVATDIKKMMETVIDPKDISGIRLIANSLLGENWGMLK
ncbi:MAG: polymerase polymerase protein [Candidatus Parcubacteria bacterium]|jgi:DNA polymerase-1